MKAPSQIPELAATHLTSSQVDALRAALSTLADDHRRQLADHEAAIDALAAAGDHETLGQREAALAAAERAREAIEEATDALQRLDAGTFGICETCGRPIPFERLEAIPETRKCVACLRPGGALI